MIKRAYDLFLTTLANMNRLKIISSLRRKNLNVGEILTETGLNQTTVSHNLNRLKTCGFVTVEQKGRYRYYQLNKETITPLLDIIDKHVKNNCRNVIAKKNRQR
ncbi:MAG: winged helix-turn-helix transcriptional regulator [DPANN group archaeon]|nr:winged helix-turn-helix transcriptional regulator [DPANN group archaeon]